MTAAAVAVKAALVNPDATVTDAGRVNALLLLARETAVPPLGAADVSVTVQASLAAPVSELLLQETALSADAGLSVIANVFAALPAVAVNVAV
ncbi:MAG: hypothetical protein WBD46_15440 [Acidobacteriaceae bacterium]